MSLFRSNQTFLFDFCCSDLLGEPWALWAIVCLFVCLFTDGDLLKLHFASKYDQGHLCCTALTLSVLQQGLEGNLFTRRREAERGQIH